MSTHSVIIGKSKEGYYVFGQCVFDGDGRYVADDKVVWEWSDDFKMKMVELLSKMM